MPATQLRKLSPPAAGAGGALIALGALLLAAGPGCSDHIKTDAEVQADIVTNMHALVLSEIQGLKQAALDLQAAAPSTFANGWDSSAQAALSLGAMRAAWVRARSYWESSEGTLSRLFPDLDASMDSRYEDLLAALGDAPDPDPFDGQGLTGMHAIERIIYAPGPDAVVAYEATLPGYQQPMWPGSDDQAFDFKTGLCQRLVSDSQSLLDRFGPLSIDLGVVFDGLTGLIDSQAEKVKLVAAHQEESRYSETTMADLRSNLAGTREVYALFVPWLSRKTFGTMLDDSATQAFDRLDQTYSTVAGDTVPPPPPTWNPSNPSVADLQSPFGIFYSSVVLEVDPNRAGSAVYSMNSVAVALGLPPFAGN